MKLAIRKRDLASAILCFSALVPFLRVFPSFTAQIFCTFVAALYLVYPAVKKGQFRNGVLMILLMWLIWVGLSYSGFNGSRVSYYLPMYAYMIMVYAMSQGKDGIGGPIFLIKATGFLSAAATIFFYLNESLYRMFVQAVYPADSELLLTGYVQGNLAGLYNHYSKNGMVLAIAIGLLFISILFSDNKKDKRNKILLTLIVAVALFFTGKRGPVIFALCAILVCYKLYLGKSLKVSKLIKVLIGIGFLVAAFFVAAQFVPQLARIIQRFEEADASGNLSMGRDVLYMLAYNLFLRNPVWGNGWFSFAELNGQFEGSAHNIYLQLLCETGIVGLLFFVILFVYFIVNTIRQYQFTRTAEAEAGCLLEARKRLLFSVYVQVFFVLYGLTGNPLYDTMMLCPYFVAVGIYVYYRYNPNAGLRRVNE